MSNRRLSQRFERQAQDFADLQNEVAGRDVGRVERFLGEAAENHIDRDKSRSKREELLTNLQIMMANDPEYAQLFRQTETRLREVQNRLDEALHAIQRERERIQERLRDQLTEAERHEEEARLEALAELESGILSGQAEIGDLQERLHDEDNAPTADELRRIAEEAERIASELEARVEAEQSLHSSPTNDQARNASAVATITIPEI